MLSTSLVFFTATVATRYGLGIGEEAGEQGSRGAGEQGSRGAEEQGSRGAEEKLQ
ncbi:MAG: hypothetical protein V7K64_15070 [Nostoc sp.]|uniref:hypothetical protein n=1 Tax=Nostoc sp. TaxID=1180 RepID=UPI002FF1191D